MLSQHDLGEAAWPIVVRSCCQYECLHQYRWCKTPQHGNLLTTLIILTTILKNFKSIKKKNIEKHKKEKNKRLEK